MEIWEPKPLGTLWATRGLLLESLNIYAFNGSRVFLCRRTDGQTDR